MGLSESDRAVIAALHDGLPLEPRPYEAVATAAGLAEGEVVERLGRLIEEGAVRRFGVIVRHHELGYRANAMVVWDVPDEVVALVGRRLARLPFITLCYRRPRRPPIWPYNLFCMIHGRDRHAVERQVEKAAHAAGLTGLPRDILFSKRRFKQRGARYGAAKPSEGLA
jgi:DNA-binding Lrp family transcriptional regulator